MKGKDRCKILKDIRKRIAEENDIEFIVSECKHKGDCLGTCPKCESELRFLERELEKRRRLGKTVTVAGLAISVALATTSCIPDLFKSQTDGDMMPDEGNPELFSSASDGEFLAPLDGETEEIQGDMPPESESEVFTGKMGALMPDTEEELPETVDIPGELVAPESDETAE